MSKMSFYTVRYQDNLHASTTWFVDKNNPTHVCKLHKALYGLKQAPQAWNARFASYLSRLGFVTAKSDTSLFVLRQGHHIAYLLLYVDDIVLTGSSQELISGLIS